MTIQTIASALIIVILIGWIGFRQVSWRPVSLSRIWRLPALLTLAALIVLVRTKTAAPVSALDLTVLLAELAVSAGIGLWMGSLARIRPLANPITDPRRPATVEARTGWWGLALWILLIAVRIALGVLAAAAGSHLAASVGVILLVVAVNRALVAAVLVRRVGPAAPVAA